MKDLNNLVVFIKDEAMLEEARRILVENGEKICHPYFKFGIDKYNYLQKDEIFKDWILCYYNTSSSTEITLTELETILKEG